MILVTISLPPPLPIKERGSLYGARIKLFVSFYYAVKLWVGKTNQNLISPLYKIEGC